MSFSVNVDPTNPGQFFACCGLLEQADRLWPGAEGWFENGQFHVTGKGNLEQFHRQLTTTSLALYDPDDPIQGRIKIDRPFDFLIDWWHEGGGREDARDFKLWAGSMNGFRIAQAMCHAMRDNRFATADMLNVSCITYEPDDPAKKVEPFNYDAHRGPNAHSRDVGFSPNDLSMTTTASPAVEFLCLVGLQRCLPARTETPRVYDYFTWSKPLPPELLPPAVSGLLPQFRGQGHRFENWFRTGQKKHKAFRPAIPRSTNSR